MGAKNSQEAPKVKSIYFPDFEQNLPSMEGTTVVITGTTSGTGYVAARTIATKGASIIALNRPSARLEKAKKQLEEEAPSAKIQWVSCDLQDLHSVKNAAETVKRMCPQGIDVLCNNAGVSGLEDKATVDGYDVQMQTNHLSHFLLTKELYPLLEKAAQTKGTARIVNHTSELRNHPSTPLKPEYLEKNGGNLGGNGSSLLFGGARWERYHQTKLANAVFTKELKERLGAGGSKVISVSAHPGLAATDLSVSTAAIATSGGFIDGLVSKLMSLFSQSPEDGTMPLLMAICDPEAKSGDLYGPSKYGATSGPPKKLPMGPLVENDAGNVLWPESEKACGKFEILI